MKGSVRNGGENENVFKDFNDEHRERRRVQDSAEYSMYDWENQYEKHQKAKLEEIQAKLDGDKTA